MSLAAAWGLATQDYWPWLLVPVAVGLAWLGYRRTTPPLEAARRTPLVILRSIAYVLLLFVLASPVLHRDSADSQRARVAVLVDESASMSTRDVAGGPTRFARAGEALRALQNGVHDVPVDLEVVAFAVHPREPARVEDFLARADSATGAATDILQALRVTGDRLAGENLQAVVLLTDGRATDGGLDAGLAAGLGRPIFCVGLGDTLPPHDLAIGRVDYNPIAYVESETEIGVRVEHSGYRGHSTTLRLLQDGHEIFRQTLGFDQDRGRVGVRIPLQLKTPGRQRYQLVLDPLADERTTRNNSRELRIEVLKNRIRALVLTARPDWDVAFLARTLRDDPNVRVVVAHRDAAGGWVSLEDGRSFTLPRGPSWARDWDLVVVGNGGRDLDTASSTELIAAINGGRGLLVLAGRDLAGADTPFGAALPVRRGRARGPVFGAANVQLTPQGRTHAITASLAAVAGPTGQLTTAAPLLGRLDMVPVPGALVLLAIDTSPATPALVVGRHGQGQIAVWNGFPYWRWALTDREPVRRAALDYVGALTRWLVQPTDVQPVMLTVPKNVFESGESIDLTAQVLDAQLLPVDDAEVRVDLRHTDAEARAAATVLLQRRAGKPGEYAGVLPGQGAGEYEATAIAQRNGRELGKATARFTVDAYSAEFADTRQDADFLNELAARTGGRMFSPEQMAELAHALPHEAHRLVRRSEVELWNTTPLFILFVLALGAEWLLRKRFGML